MKKNYWIVLILGFCLCSLLIGSGCDIEKAKYQRTENVSVPLESGSTLVAETSFGSITVIGADVADCNITATIYVKAPTEEEAKEIAEKVKIKLEPADKTLKVKAEKPRVKKKRSIGVSFEIIVPKQTNVDCASSFGKIRLANLNGNAKAKTSSGSITAENIKGPAKLDTSFGSINCKNISGGDIKLKTSSGKITLTKAAFGDCDVHTSFGSITSGELTGNSLKLKSNSGNINLTEASADTTNIHTSFGRITCRQITSSDLTARSSSGSIDIACSDSTPPEINANVVTSFGSIDFVTPPNFAGQVELATSFGSINTNLPITIIGEVGKKKLTGKIGEGKGKLHLQTNSGSIKIK
ncbi:MAG TPA: DUF4097 family beta strand repeat-containing protein [Sedimentisphaerales bacterium]|nr:DUF4097 family beta strand repeat-containing protein [Sedimentisphaerales bacterium]